MKILSPSALSRIVLSSTALVLALVALGVKAEEARKDGQSAEPAKQEKSRGDGCVFSRNINDWQVIDNRTVAVWAPTRKTPYVVELTMPATGLKFEHTLGFEDRNADGRFCDYGGDSIIIGGPVPERVPVAKVRRVDPEELKLMLAEAQKPRPKASATMPEQSDMKSDKSKSEAADNADKAAPEKPK